MLIIEGSFDPVCKAEIEEIKRIRKQTNTKDIYVTVKEDGTLPIEERTHLLSLAIKPYRHIHLTNQKNDHMISFEKYEDLENQARSGHMSLCAYGTRKYLFEHGYYFETSAKALCKPNRYEHSIRTAKTCVEIAKHYNYDLHKAYFAGVLHDITKAYTIEQGKQVISIYKPEWLELSDKVWHSYTATIYLKQNMAYYDQDILHAIEHHTLGDGNSILDHILYIADKIEPGRGYDTSKQFELACHDLKACVELVKQEGKEYRKTKGIKE